MKKIFLILVVCFSFLDAYIDECKSDVYFANGIDTSEDVAKYSVEKIQEHYKLKYSQNFNSVKNWDIVYNHTHGIGIDLYESMLQKIYEDEVGHSFLPFLWNAGEIADYFTLSFKGVVKRIAKKAPKEQVKEYAADAAKKLAKKAFLVYNKKYGTKYTQEEIELMFSEVFDYLIEKSTDSFIDMSEEELLEQEVADVADHIHAYKQSILDGHGVILVAHSQGNLFVNRAYNEFGKLSDINKDAWMKPYIHAIGVASPANNILGEASPYMTFDNDVIQVIPDSLPTNVTNPARYFFTNALDEEIETILSVKAHSFLTSYMATDITRNSILDFINIQIDEHKNAPSQWEQDQELNQGTKDYRITVKHRFDPNITEMDGVKVFPFAPSKKLYYVDGNIVGYVKASCGGTQIFDSWENKNIGDDYQLFGTGEIIAHQIISNKIKKRTVVIGYSIDECEFEGCPVVTNEMISKGDLLTVWFWSDFSGGTLVKYTYVPNDSPRPADFSDGWLLDAIDPAKEELYRDIESSQVVEYVENIYKSMKYAGNGPEEYIIDIGLELYYK